MAPPVETSRLVCELSRAHLPRSTLVDWDDLKPKPVKVATLGENLTTFSVGELEARIAALKEEIARVEAELAAKKAHEAAAAALFKR
jgi:uncharacterized small protein (DUF1192 family)